VSKTVLVVDDEMLIALDIQAQLEELGHKVLTASSLARALAIVETERVDVAIIDWYLRDDNSAPITDLLQQRQIPFVLCSGSALEELARLFPTSPILSKPYASEELVGAVNRLIDESLVH
jgi:CheY-like chemotaxis protein